MRGMICQWQWWGLAVQCVRYNTYVHMIWSVRYDLPVAEAVCWVLSWEADWPAGGRWRFCSWSWHSGGSRPGTLLCGSAQTECWTPPPAHHTTQHNTGKPLHCTYCTSIYIHHHTCTCMYMYMYSTWIWACYLLCDDNWLLKINVWVAIRKFT